MFYKMVQGLDQKTLMVLSGIFSSVNFAYKIVEMTITQKSTNTIQKCKKNKGKMTNTRLEKKGGYIERGGDMREGGRRV